MGKRPSRVVQGSFARYRWDQPVPLLGKTRAAAQLVRRQLAVVIEIMEFECLFAPGAELLGSQLSVTILVKLVEAGRMPLQPLLKASASVVHGYSQTKSTG